MSANPVSIPVPVDESQHALVESCWERAFRFAALVTRNDQEAEDVAQEAMARALRHLHRYDSRHGPFEAWLWRIVVNVARDAWRRRRSVALLVTAAAGVGVTVTAAAYPGGLAGLTQDALRAAGLSSSTQQSAVSGSGERAGVRVVVNGGYADRLSTVLFVALTPPCEGGATCAAGFSGAPYLLDEHGTRYATTGGVGIGVGPYPIFFQPLHGPVATLTLHVPIYTAPRGQAPSEVVVSLAGVPQPAGARELAAPRPVTDSQRDVTYAITGIFASGSYLEVHTRLTGTLESVITHYPAAGGGVSGRGWPGVFLVGPGGGWQIPLAGSGEPPTVNDHVQDETRIFSVKPGGYRVVVATTGQRNSAPGPDWTVFAQWDITVP